MTNSTSSIPSSLPVPHSTTPFWRQSPHPLDTHQSTTNSALPSRADILIIGGGYAGIATAYHLLHSTTTTSPSSSSPPRIVLLEARQACSGATGRNGGHLRPDVALGPARYAQRHGAGPAAEVARFERDHIDAVQQLVKDEGIDCDFEEARSLAVYTTAEQAAESQARVEQVRADPVMVELLEGTELYVGDEAPERTGVKGAKGYFASPAAHLWPYKLVMGLLSRALDLGLILQTQTPVLSVRQEDKLPHITTPHGTITADKVVFATNAYTSALLPEYAAAIIPCKGLACRITTNPSSSSMNTTARLPRLPASSMVIRETLGSVQGYSYIIQRSSDNALIVGGAHQTYRPDRPSWYNTTDDSTLIASARAFYDGYAQRTFVGWDENEEVAAAEVDEAWSGIMGYSADSLPHVGAVPGREGAFVLAGFNGHGMPAAYLAAKGVAEMVGLGRAYEETGLPALYKTSKERLAPQYDDILGGSFVTSQANR